MTTVNRYTLLRTFSGAFTSFVTSCPAYSTGANTAVVGVRGRSRRGGNHSKHAIDHADPSGAIDAPQIRISMFVKLLNLDDLIAMLPASAWVYAQSMSEPVSR